MVQADDELAVEVAWLYYVYELNQEAIARQLGISRFKVMRLLAAARSNGAVQISVTHEVPKSVELSQRLKKHLGIDECVVSPPLQLAGGSTPAQQEALRRRAAGVAAANYITGRCEGKTVVGVGWGSTIAEFAYAFRHLKNPDLQFVSLAGSLLRNSAANPFEVVQTLARNTGGEAFFLPSPYIVDQQSDVSVILSQRVVREALDLARQADFYIVGAGECSREATTFRSGLLDESDLKELERIGATCETTGVYFREDGSFVETDVGTRTIGIEYRDLVEHNTVLLAAGRSKLPVIRTLCKSGIVNCLVIDGDTATELLAVDG